MLVPRVRIPLPPPFFCEYFTQFSKAVVAEAEEAREEADEAKRKSLFNLNKSHDHNHFHDHSFIQDHDHNF